VPITFVRKAVEDPVLAVAAKMQGRMAKALLDAVDAMKGSVNMQALADAVSAGDYNQALAVLALDTNFVRVLNGHGVKAGVASFKDAVQQAFAGGAQAAVKALPEKVGADMSFDLLNPEAVNFLQSYSFNLIHQISEEARNSIRQKIVRAFQEGGHPFQQAREIRDSIGLTQNQEKAVANYKRALQNNTRLALERQLRDRRFDPSVQGAINAGQPLDPAHIDKLVDRYRSRYIDHRARTIARTETNRASVMGQRTVWRQARHQGFLDPDTTERRWIVSGDSNTCDDCDELDEETVGLDEEFPDGDPPLHPACRCSVGLVFNVSKADRVGKADWDESQHPRDERGRFGEGGGERMDVGPRTYREPAKPEAPFQTVLPKDDRARVMSEQVIREGREFMRERVPAFEEARERAAWAGNRLDRIEKVMKTQWNTINKIHTLPLTEQDKPEVRARFQKAQDEMDAAVKRAGYAQERLRQAEKDVNEKLGEWIESTVPTRAVEAKIEGFDPITTDRLQGLVGKFERLTGGASGRDNTVAIRPMRPEQIAKGARAYYSYDKRHVRLTPGQIRESTVIHELGHWFEHNNAEVQADVQDWLKYRTAGEPLKEMKDIYPTHGYDKGELTREDKFMHAYIGKEYGDKISSEVVSMGFQYLFQKPAEFYKKDPDHFLFTMGLISKISRRQEYARQHQA